MDKKEQQRIAKELGKYLASDDSLYTKGPIERRFIDWFVDANFKLSLYDYTLTDRKKDGGIDAVLVGRKEIFLLQSKYERSFKVNTLSRNELQAFERVRDYFAEDSADFDRWIKTVDGKLVGLYTRIREKKKQGVEL